LHKGFGEELVKMRTVQATLKTELAKYNAPDAPKKWMPAYIEQQKLAATLNAKNAARAIANILEERTATLQELKAGFSLAVLSRESRLLPEFESVKFDDAGLTTTERALYGQFGNLAKTLSVLAENSEAQRLRHDLALMNSEELTETLTQAAESGNLAVLRIAESLISERKFSRKSDQDAAHVALIKAKGRISVDEVAEANSLIKEAETLLADIGSAGESIENGKPESDVRERMRKAQEDPALQALLRVAKGGAHAN